MAAEERHKSPSKLGRAGEERQKVPLGVALGVCSIGSESLTLPVTLVKVPWKGAFSLAEAERAELELLGFAQLVTQCIQGVSADHTSQ